jgi:hypothetical protein
MQRQGTTEWLFSGLWRCLTSRVDTKITTGGLGVVGSNPAAPTNEIKHLQINSNRCGGRWMPTGCHPIGSGPRVRAGPHACRRSRATILGRMPGIVPSGPQAHTAAESEGGARRVCSGPTRFVDVANRNPPQSPARARRAGAAAWVAASQRLLGIARRRRDRLESRRRLPSARSARMAG